MHLAFDIFQGLGVAAAVGIRPFLPALAVGALAAGDVGIHFTHTDYRFLQSAPFLLAMALGAIVLALFERRFGEAKHKRRPVTIGLGLVALALGALLFAGSLARGRYATWPGLAAGVLGALVGLAATRPLFARVRARLDESTAAVLPVYAEGLALLLAALSILAPPIGLVGLLLLLWLLFAGWRRGEQKYAGLRILR
jgi:hypothetical protein